jgi:hypothetical protein
MEKSLLILWNNNNLAMYTTITGELLRRTTPDFDCSPSYHYFILSLQTMNYREGESGWEAYNVTCDLNYYYVASQ